MIKISSLSTAVFTLAISACGSSVNTGGDSQLMDFTGTWSGVCKNADTSLAVNIGELYYYDTLEITETQITSTASIFSDSDCVTPFVVDFIRNAPFEQGEYTVGEKIVTQSGLTAFKLQIQDIDSGSVFDNIIALVQDTLYFGYNPIDGPSNTTASPLLALELDNGFSKQ